MTGTHAGELVVAVHDEPALVLAGVQILLERAGVRGRVLPLRRLGADERADVVLCDPLRGAPEPAAYVALVRELGRAPVVAFSWSGRPRDVRRALEAGAAAFVPKQAGAAQLATALLRVRVPVAAGIAGAVGTGAPTGPVDGPPEVVLSEREAAVLQLICQGASNLEIADALFVSVSSVKTWVGHVYRKIGVSRRAQAVAWGIAHDY